MNKTIIHGFLCGASAVFVADPACVSTKWTLLGAAAISWLTQHHEARPLLWSSLAELVKKQRILWNWKIHYRAHNSSPTHATSIRSILQLTSHLCLGHQTLLTSAFFEKKNITSSVYDCTVEDVEYIYNKLSIHIFNSKSRLSGYRCILHLQQYSHRQNLLYFFFFLPSQTHIDVTRTTLLLMSLYGPICV